MSKIKFFQAVLQPIDTDTIIQHVYPNMPEGRMTLAERLGDCKCPDCEGTEWFILPKECVAVREGGKPYIECLGCGYSTHL